MIKIKLPDDPFSSNVISTVFITVVGTILGITYSFLFKQLSVFNLAALCAGAILFVAGSFVLILSADSHGRSKGEALIIIFGIFICWLALISFVNISFSLPRPDPQLSDVSVRGDPSLALIPGASPQLSATARPNVGTQVLLLFPSGAILFALLWQLGVRDQAKRVRHNFGFATTGVLAVQTTDGSGNFLLVLNKNLRNGKGLWVPPGGHIDVFSERPEDRVVEKILLETGLNSTVVEVNSMMLPPVIGRRTDLCTWHTPPAFLLREDLQGFCGKFHRIHLDFVYILISTDQQTSRLAKYGNSDRILIPISDCFSSHDSAKNATIKTIDAWRANQGLQPASMQDNCTADVTMRLHLAAQHLIRVGIIK